MLKFSQWNTLEAGFLCLLDMSINFLKQLYWDTIQFTHQYFISFYCQIIFYLMDISHCASPSVAIHLGFFYFGAIVNKAAMNMYILVSVWTYILIFLGCVLRDRIFGSYGNYVLHFKELHSSSFSKQQPHFCNPTSNVWGVQVLPILVNTCYDKSKPCEVASWFWFAFQ